MKLNVEQMKAYLEGNKSKEEEVINSFECLKSLFLFMKNTLRLEHKKIHIENIRIIMTENVEIKCEYVFMLLKFGISKGNIST